MAEHFFKFDWYSKCKKVWCREIREGKDRKNKFSIEWTQGIWLGHSRNSLEFIIGTEDEVVRIFAVRRERAMTGDCTTDSSRK